MEATSWGPLRKRRHHGVHTAEQRLGCPTPSCHLSPASQLEEPLGGGQSLKCEGGQLAHEKQIPF